MDVDLGTAGMDATETTKEILNKKDIPILFLYSNTAPKAVEKTGQVASCGYVEKNSGEAVLTASIKAAFRLHDSRNLYRETSSPAPQANNEGSIQHLEYRDLVETIQEGIWNIDTDGFTTYVNPKMAEMLELTPDEMIGKHLFDFMDTEAVEHAKTQMARRASGIKEQHEFTFQKKGGEPLEVLLETTPLYDDEGAYNGALAAVIDITRRKETERRLRESERKYRTVVEELQEGLGLVDEDENILFANPAFCRIFGYTSEELTSMNLEKVVSESHFKRLEEETVRRKKNESSTYEIKITRKDGDLRDIKVRAAPIFNEHGNFQATLGLVRDITEEKKIRESERRSREKLEKPWRRTRPCCAN